MRNLSIIKRGRVYHAKFDIPAGVDEAGNPIFRQILRTMGTGNRSEATRKANELRETMLAEAGAGEEKSRKLLSILRQAGDMAIRGELSEDVARLMLGKMVEISKADH